MSEKKCIGDHKIHICELAAQKKFEEIIKLAEHPQLMCFNCGRVSNIPESLCCPKAYYELVPGISMD